MLRNFFISFSIFLLFCQIAFSGAGSSTQIFRGESRLKDGSPYFKEVTTAQFKNGRLENSVTKYYSNDDQLKAELNSDFSKSDLLPDTAFIDFRDNYQYTSKINVEQKRIDLSTKENEKSEWKRSNLKYSDHSMLFQGLIKYIGQQKAQLKDKKTLEVELIIPSRFDAVNVLLEPLAANIEKDDDIKIKVKAKSALVRMIMAETILTFDSSLNKILKFEGNHPLLDSNDKSQKVTIKYKY